MDQFWFYFKLGLNHVLDINAYDHVLFFIVLTVPYTFSNWKRVLWLVTIFTLGHTLSLILATYGVVTASSGLVECLIPITIFITAVFNIFTAGKGAKREKFGLAFFATLFFGLIHGLGFSTYFKQIVASASNKLVPLLEFALGIEASQIIVVIIVLIIGFLVQNIFRFNKRDWIMVISAIVIGFVIPMLINSCAFN
ncbi:HupE/UreJ family protein [Galbibacter pacificus]|uniref:HupE/UreJ family protein n=1 Tax=Galbibacter pacificus TaxID=2996052 RepID=A0ABT6FTW3_9FLAO|nr:HupE/UreJ family protein [Galbibacter pacificus]MDG3583226.1 HupE/UreJ family protein [Galbibacter pacificus]MDG3586707.1 HupE/UreJ family protein [Galbibacter pacificus]